jgi:lactoylglutathione lyase
MFDIHSVDHVGIRVADPDRALAFYAKFGFAVHLKAENYAVIIIRNAHGVEINLIHNANADLDGRNVLMDVPEKYPGYTHVAFRVLSVAGAIALLKENAIPITQGPVSFGSDGHVSIFLRDPDRNVIELRGRQEDAAALGGVEEYRPLN